MEYKCKEIEGFHGYAVDTNGVVWSAFKKGKGGIGDNWKKLSSKPFKNGYVYIGFTRFSKKKTVHSLVLETFIGKKLKGMEVRHLDGNKENNKLENLCWGNRSENMADRVLHGTSNRGQRQPLCKLNVQKVKLARLLYGNFKWSFAKIFKTFGSIWGVKYYTIWSAVSPQRKSWWYV